MHTAPLVALDWSDDGAVLQSDWCVASSRPLHLWVAGPLLTQRYDGSLPRLRSARGEHLFWDTRTCAQLDAASAAQCVWASASCTHQWALKGVPEVLGARGLLGCTRRSHGGSALACAGLDGALTLVGYPSVSPDAAALRYADGCAPIKARALRIQPRELLLPLLPRCRCDGSCCMWPADAVRSICTRQALSWAGDDGVLLTLSSRGELFQWKHLGGEPNAASAASAASAAADEAAYDSDIENELTHSSAASAHALFAPPQPAEQSSATAAWAGGASADADGTLSLIWGGATDGAPAGVGGSRVGAHHADLHAPSAYSPSVDALEAPPDGLQLEWVYGCRGHDAHGSVRWTASGEVAFHAAAVGAVYDPRSHTQRFFLGHSNELLCLTSHPSGLAVATGQAGGAALSCIQW
jgi:hypothetical protein